MIKFFTRNYSKSKLNVGDFNIIHDRAKKVISKVTNTGFHVQGLQIEGPIIVLNQQVILWDVPQYGVGGPKDDVEPLDKDVVCTDPSSPFYGWKTEMFNIFEKVEPKPELLLLGSGGAISSVPQPIKEYVNKLGIQIDVLNSRHASSTFNVLVEEGRNSALALLPYIPTSARTGKVLVEVQKKKPKDESEE
ncbi:hypothetical protein HK103_004547 [Boothiomyces macroporosus]|uniref:NADH dehydrogenase [ubiquinone] 1 alpha subcomplex assembly factor 3 n=1 Tax=Boothiomyces macroporosus TaxID=261099 RepID=A0AAD5UKT8_9FUNG|nr:hypothetical protein HK103_004547 [Boothiomyces macroporosus]